MWDCLELLRQNMIKEINDKCWQEFIDAVKLIGEPGPEDNDGQNQESQ